jgi:membrane-bound lytic murein transglycosylase D
LRSGRCIGALALTLLTGSGVAALDFALPGLPGPGLDHRGDTGLHDARQWDGPAQQVLQPEPDLLDIIANGLSLPDADERRVEQEYAWYARNPEYLERVFTRAQRYLPHIVAEIKARGMPLDLALLPVVESAFDPFAYSHGRAAGLWQFIPGTGKLYGLTQDWWYDGRRDVVASTDAALNYLQALHNKLDGDWLLAIAAYNSGEGRVRGAVRKNTRAGRPTDFWNLSLPRETRAYVPKLLAIGRIVKRRAELAANIAPLSPERYFAVAELDGQIDLALAAELASVTLDEIYRLNPGFNRWATSPTGPHRLLVPIATHSLFLQRLAEVPAEERVQWQRYRIKSGDALSTIAARHGVTTQALRDSNGIKGNRIRAGDYLLIPSASRDLASYTLSADGRQQRRLSAEGERYVVKPGDSFWTIGQRFGVSSGAIARWNGMAPADTLAVGRELIIRRSGSQSASAPPPASRGPSDAQRRIAYVVRRGDSLAGISSRFRVSVSQLVAWNQLDRNQYLQPGQRLVMYVDVTRQSGG